MDRQVSPHHTYSSPSPYPLGTPSHAPIHSEQPQDTKELHHLHVGQTSLHCPHQSILPFQVQERRFLYFSGRDGQPRFSTPNQSKSLSMPPYNKALPTQPDISWPNVSVSQKRKRQVLSKGKKETPRRRMAGKVWKKLSPSKHLRQDKRGHHVGDPAPANPGTPE